jgi:hypothetical protein
MESPGLVKRVIRERAIAKAARERAQRALWGDWEDFKETIRAKLSGFLDTPQFWSFSACGQQNLTKCCRGCGQRTNLTHRCNLKWCPSCQWRLVEHRKKIIGLWATKIDQPKHLVLTQANFEVLTPRKIREHTKHLAMMRRSKSFKLCKGGCVSVEITNEKKGWHLHSHWLVDCRWFEMPDVARAWGKLVGQEFAIVKVKDVHDEGYLSEVSKYVVKGDDLAKWPGEHIAEFVRAIKGRRFFFPFGSLFKHGPEIRKALRGEERPQLPCECGCEDFIYRDEVAEIVADLKRNGGRSSKSLAVEHAAKQSAHRGSQRNEVGRGLFDSSRDTIASG